MKFLLDTHLLLWAAREPHRLSDAARRALDDLRNEPVFSVVSVWEVAIKARLPRRDFQVDSRLFRSGLLSNNYEELEITGRHVIAVEGLPPIHKDPFDRLLIAQAISEGIPLLTGDPTVARYATQYSAPIRRV